ncbi:hypothetical protein BG005_009273 [Podila minutissima]|nr:hypothetical protein BG005_009273 [Podila minutissima]
MSRKPTSSKFGHLFGDTSEGSSSSKESRLSSSSDLYKDPLAALIPPVTATTTTTRASTARGTLSPPSISANSATATPSKGSPPGSSSNSRSSSRLQHHALFSSLTQQDSGGSLFESSSSTKRDLLFGESGTNTSSSSTSRRTSTPPLSRINNTSTSQQSSRVPTPPLGTSTQVRGTSLDADSSPLGISTAVVGAKEDDSRSVTSPLLTTEPLARTSSAASNTSSKSSSTRSIKSVLSQEEPVPTTPTSTGPLKASAKESTPIPPITAPVSTARTPVKKASVSSTKTVEKPTSPTASIPDPIFNPLASTLPPSSLSTGDWPNTSSSQSIDTFQSISRTSSPAVSSSSRTKSVFPQDLDSPSPSVSSSVSRSTSPPVSTVSTTSTITNAAVNIPQALDDAAAAFAGDMLYNPPPAHQHMLPGRSSSFLDSGFTSRNQKTENGTVNITTTTGSSAIKLGGSTGSSAGAIPGATAGLSRSGFSLGEDVADASNPWMNSLADSLEQTKLTQETSRVDYTQSISSGGGGNDSFLPEVAFTLGSSKGEATRAVPLSLPVEDEGGFDDIFSSLKSKVPGLTSSSSSKSKMTTSPSMASGSNSIGNGDLMSISTTTTTTWNILDAVEAASMDPDFLGATGPQARAKEKVLAMMQMPKDPLEKDISAQEVFDNPWE